MNIQGHVDRMYALVHHLSTTTDACPTCGLDSVRTPLFSTPVTAPYKADLALTYGCNNACRHCYNRAESKSPLRSPTAIGQEIARARACPFINGKRYCKNCSHIGVPHVIFTGGEPTLFPGLIELIRRSGTSWSHHRPEHQRPAIGRSRFCRFAGQCRIKPRADHAGIVPSGSPQRHDCRRFVRRNLPGNFQCHCLPDCTSSPTPRLPGGTSIMPWKRSIFSISLV